MHGSPGRILEVQVLELLRHRKNYTDFRDIVQPTFFSAPETRAIFQAIQDHLQIGVKPFAKLANLDAWLSMRVKDQDVRKEARRLLRTMQKVAPSIDQEVVRALALEWSKKSLAKQALYEGVEALNEYNGIDLDALRDKFDHAARLGLRSSEIYDYFGLHGNRLQERTMQRPVATGIPAIDESLQGGLDIGEIGVIIGPTHRGKTRALVNLGSAALNQGKIVAHVIVCDSTASRIARRYDSVLTDKLFSDLQVNPNLLVRRMANIKRKGGKLIIKEYDKVSPTPNDLRLFLRHFLDSQGLKMDLLIIDYLDEMKAGKHYNEPRFESRDVTSAVRRLGAEFSCAVWTASQGNRNSFSKKNVDLDDVAEDIWKVNQADVVFTLNQTEDEKDENMIRYRLAKARRERFFPKTIFLDIHESGLVVETVQEETQIVRNIASAKTLSAVPTL